MTTTVQLHETLPREQIGAVTGDRYDFQYHQAAADALQVLDDTKIACVYCEWHDDYVIEAAGIVRYRFHQVKTRSRSQGPWTINEFFGIKPGRGRKPKNPTASSPALATADADSIFGRLFDHVSRFGTHCDCFIFVTDAGITSEFENLISTVHGASDFSKIPQTQAQPLAQLHADLSKAFKNLTVIILFDFLKRLHVHETVGTLANLKACRTLIAGRIHEMSEVDLSMSEAQKIGADLVSLVRDKSHRVLPMLPTSKEELQKAKGLVLEDVLRILSLSTSGYRALQSGGRDSIITLSRFHRLCKKSNVPDTLIPDLCRQKALWDMWWVKQRHTVNALDMLALKSECANALSLHATGKFDFKSLVSEARLLSNKYESALTSSDPITGDLVFGFMMSLAAEAEQ